MCLKILITGASRGIGKNLFDHYRKRGEEVIGLSTKDCNLSLWDETFSFFDQERFNEIDILIHCAAFNVTKFFYKMDSKTFKQLVDTNIIGTFNLLKCTISRLKEYGSIIIFSSAATFSPRVGQSGYACCKSALHGLVKVLAKELIVENKYIFLIAPGIVETGMPMDMMSELALKKATEIIPMKRYCKIEEIINAIDFLYKTPYMTGQTIHINGGYFIL